LTDSFLAAGDEVVSECTGVREKYDEEDVRCTSNKHLALYTQNRDKTKYVIV
jgi:hypothetical protein